MMSADGVHGDPVIEYEDQQHAASDWQAAPDAYGIPHRLQTDVAR